MLQQCLKIIKSKLNFYPIILIRTVNSWNKFQDHCTRYIFRFIAKKTKTKCVKIGLNK